MIKLLVVLKKRSREYLFYSMEVGISCRQYLIEYMPALNVRFILNKLIIMSPRVYGFFRNFGRFLTFRTFI